MNSKSATIPGFNVYTKYIKNPAVFLCLVWGIMFNSASLWANSLDDEIQNLEEFSTVYQLIKTKYIKAKTSHELIRSAITGMVKELDPYSNVLSAQDLKKLELQSVGQYVGIGVTINQSDNKFIVTQVFKGSPADKAGINSGDEIIKINNTVLADVKYAEIHQLLQGDFGVDLKIEYINAAGILHRVKVRRVMVKANSVECHSYSKQIGVLTIHQFMKHTARELSDCMHSMSYSAVILDLRNNPGGLLISAVEVADLFVDIGEIVQIRDKQNKIMERYVARTSIPKDHPLLFVLINRFSASSSEILAGAIRDRGSGVLIGEKSFGKGVVQSVYPISDDLFIKITTALYYTPSEIGFDGIGITPDFVVTDSLAVLRYSADDIVFQKALNLAEKELSAK